MDECIHNFSALSIYVKVSGKILHIIHVEISVLQLCHSFVEFEFICVLRHMERYFSYIFDGTDMQAD